MSGTRAGAGSGPGLLAMALFLTVLAFVGGCSDESNELRLWMDQVRSSTRPVQETIAEPKRFDPFRYDRAGQSDPFAPTRLGGLSLEVPEATKGGGLRPDTMRRREILEDYPLDAIRMVGHLSNDRQSFALLQIGDLVHKARVGNHAGQDFGLITRISESEVRLRELVQDASGDWVHRETILHLQQGGGK